MKNSKYLYGRDTLKGLSNMNYKEAIEAKINLAESVISSLLKLDYRNRDMNRVNDCIKAIKFNEKLLEEIKDEI